MCPGHRPDSSYINIDFVLDIIDQLQSAGIKAIVLSGGGEPILHPNIIDIIKYINSKGINIGLVTSGQRNFSYNKMEYIIRSLTWLRISLDAGTPEIYKLTHGIDQDKYKTVLNFIQDALSARKKTDSQCTIGVGYLTGWNHEKEIEDYEQAALICAKMGVDYFQLRPLNFSNKVYEFSDYIKKSVASINNKMRLVKSRHKYDFFDTTRIDYRRPYKYCHISYFTTIICVNGGVYVCCDLRNQPTACIGNLHQKSFIDIWKNVNEVTAKVNIDNCLPHCKNDNANRIIDRILQNKDNNHKNFI